MKLAPSIPHQQPPEPLAICPALCRVEGGTGRCVSQIQTQHCVQSLEWDRPVREPDGVQLTSW